MSAPNTISPDKLNRFIGIAGNDSFHQATMLLVAILALNAGFPSNVTIPLGAVEQILAIGLDATRSAGGDEAGVKIAVRDLPRRAAFAFMARQMSRRSRHAMERQDDGLFPCRIAVLD